jgi:hypothetical protein
MATETLAEFMQLVHVNWARLNSKVETATSNGADGCFSSQTRTGMALLASQTRQLIAALGGHFPIERVQAKRLLTDVNEHFHAKMRQMIWGGMPSLRQFLRYFFSAVIQTVQRLCDVGFIVGTPTGREYYESPDTTGLKWDAMEALMVRPMATTLRALRKKLGLTKKQLANLNELLASLIGSHQATPRSRTCSFFPGSAASRLHSNEEARQMTGRKLMLVSVR